MGKTSNRACIRLLAACAANAVAPAASAHTDVSAADARTLIADTAGLVIVDVRERSEYCPGHIPGASNYPWNSGVFQARWAELSPDAPILSVCGSGGRSNQAAAFLDGKGYARVYDMLGGMSAWKWERTKCPVPFTRGDVHDDAKVDVADAVAILAFLFLAQPAKLACEESADADGTGEVDIGDAIHLLSWLFLGGPAPGAPFPTCGAADASPLPCDSFAACG